MNAASLTTVLKNKARFVLPGRGGALTTEQLFDLDDKQLNAVYQGLKSEQKESDVDSLISPNSTDALLAAKIDVVVALFEMYRAQQQSNQRRAEAAAERKYLTELLVSQQRREDEKLTPEQIRARLAALPQ